jgi:hypothetical protein
MVPRDGWHHLALVRDDDDTRVYVDGVLQARRGAAIPNPGSAAWTDIGQQFENRREFFQGQIAELRIWNTARSEADIRRGRFETYDPDEPGLAVRYPFDEAGGDEAVNRGSAGAAMNGSLMPGTSPSPDLRPAGFHLRRRFPAGSETMSAIPNRPPDEPAAPPVSAVPGRYHRRMFLLALVAFGVTLMARMRSGSGPHPGTGTRPALTNLAQVFIDPARDWKSYLNIYDGPKPDGRGVTPPEANSGFLGDTAFLGPVRSCPGTVRQRTPTGGFRMGKEGNGRKAYFMWMTMAWPAERWCSAAIASPTIFQGLRITSRGQ